MQIRLPCDQRRVPKGIAYVVFELPDEKVRKGRETGAVAGQLPCVRVGTAVLAVLQHDGTRRRLSLHAAFSPQSSGILFCTCWYGTHSSVRISGFVRL